MRSIVLTRNNILPNTNNSTMVYSFPNSVDLTGTEIAVNQITLYYSWENINITLQNNVFSYNWVVAGVPTTFTVTIPSGLYEIKDLNNFLQFTFIQNGHYLVNSSGENVYYAEFIINPTRYAIQINTFAVPTALPALWTNPAALVFPAVTFNPIITLPSKFNEILGYVAGFATAQNIGIGNTLSYLSSVAPNVQPNSTLLVSLTGIDNKYASPSSIIYSLPASVGLGELIVEKPSNFNFNRILSGTYSQLRLQFLNSSDLSPANIKDPNITIILVIKDDDDVKIDTGANTVAGNFGTNHSKYSRSGVGSGMNRY